SGHTITVNDIVYSQTGWYRQNLKNFDDCDSILHIHLTIEDTLRGHVYDTICYGDTYTFNGSTYSIPGFYSYVTRTRGGCDSIAYLHLHVNDTIITHVYDTICVDGAYNFLDTTYYNTGNYVHVLHRVTGCDSTVILHLFERDSIYSIHYDTICNNITYRYYDQLLTRTGRYAHRHTSVITGCDSIEWLYLKVLDNPILTILDSGAYCEGGFATLKANTNGNHITWTSSPYDPTLNGQDHNMTIYVVPQRYTEYTATVDIRPFNCLSSETKGLNKPTKVEARMLMTPEEITAENLQATFTDYSFGSIMYREWTFHENNPIIPDKIYYGDREVNYTASIESDSVEVRLVVTNDEGCYDTPVNLYPIFRGNVWVPNAFTPGRLGANRLLKVGYYNLLEYEIFIYTRDGLLVFHSNDPEISWDGTYKYTDCVTGSYVYVVHYRTKSRPSESYEKKGSVMLIR
ncbi:MAG: gliding motility-associated C-terminal domain-containing protein, partial [Bacteroidales bacterium]|nr:gliding motility-associated C-terminal domain-containing protein [Bacteroidales bacterium]